MKRQMKKLLARLLVVTLVLQMFSGICLFKTERVEAATELPIVNEMQVRERIMELAKLLEINNGSLENGSGIQFTVNGGACGHATGNSTLSDGSKCQNCLNTNVIKSEWFKKKFGYTVNIDLLPGHYYPSGNGTNAGWTCHGFVNFALWYIAKDDSTSNVYRKLVGPETMTFTKANLQANDIRIGDVMRISGLGHSVMFLGYDGDNAIKVLDCNWVSKVAADIATVKIHSISFNSSYSVAITRATNYEPDYNLSLPDSMTSSSSTEAKANIINYATSLEGWKRGTFTSAGRTDIPSGEWCAWFLKLCADKVGAGSLFSSSTGVSSFCTDMIKNYGAQAYYYTDSKYLTSADKTLLSGGTAVTKSTFTPQPGDIYILHESGYSDFSQVGFVMGYSNGSVKTVVGNNCTALEVQIRNADYTNAFYILSSTSCPIIGYIRPNYASLDKVALKGISLSATSASLNVGDTKTLTVTYNPSNTTDSKTVTWKSSNTSVATVSNGKIIAVAPGTATITATCGSKSATCTVAVKQPLNGISLSATNVTLNVGGTQTLTVSYNPNNTTDSKTVTWKTSNSTVATVSNGKITAVAPGTATITATCGSKFATCTVTVKQPLSKITLNETSLTMNVGTSETLTVTYNPNNTTDSKTVTWESSNTSVATVLNGKVTAVAPGTATITATCGSKTATCTITIKQPLSGISMSSTKLTLNVGESGTLTVIYNEANTTDSKNVTWKTSNAAVATVSNGKVTAVAPGTVTITATCGSNTATCTVTVYQPLKEITLSDKNVVLDIGGTKNLSVSYNPSNTTDSKTINWSSSDESVVVVSNGKITAVGAGTATVTAVCGSKTATCTIKVNEPKIDVSISETRIDLEVGSNKTIELTYNTSSLPEGKTLRFKSSNPSVATVSEAGVVTAIATGTVTIIVETNDGEQLAACEVTVLKDDSEDTQSPGTEIPDTNEPDTSEPGTNETESMESDSNEPDTTDTEVVDTPSPNNDVNMILVVIAAICAVGMMGMFGVVIFILKKNK